MRVQLSYKFCAGVKALVDIVEILPFFPLSMKIYIFTLFNRNKNRSTNTEKEVSTK